MPLAHTRFRLHRSQGVDPSAESPNNHDLLKSDANAFRTLLWEIPNCRAIRAGVTPALNAALTAFSFPVDNVTASISICAWLEAFSVGRRFCFTPSFWPDDFVKFPSIPSGEVPRWLASLRTTSISLINSSSDSCFTARSRFSGRTCRCEGDGAFVALPVPFLFGTAEASRTRSVENRSGVVYEVLSRPISHDAALYLRWQSKTGSSQGPPPAIYTGNFQLSTC